MKAIKQIGQVLSAIAYTCIFTGIYYMLLVLPLAWLISLPTKTMILVMILVGGIVEGLITMAGAFMLMPFGWIVKKNVVALAISIGLILFNFTYNGIALWKSMIDAGGTLPIVFAVIISIMILRTILMSIFMIAGVYSESKNE